MKQHQYFVYIITNFNKTVLYTGVTNNLPYRITEHYLNKGNPKTFAGRYHCVNLIYFEKCNYIQNAIKREKEIKGWTRSKKEALINSENPEWRFLNTDIMEWPPDKETIVRAQMLRSSV